MPTKSPIAPFGCVPRGAAKFSFLQVSSGDDDQNVFVRASYVNGIDLAVDGRGCGINVNRAAFEGVKANASAEL